jgi:hypothetical protein
MTLVTLAAASLLALLSIPSAVQAGELAAPIGKVVLEVSGAITHTNRDGIAAYDVDMLEALESRTTVTTTPWYDGPRRFSGPLGQAVIDSIGATGTTLRVTAINDYVTDIPLADLMEYPVILATRLDGERMSVREKGPIFVIYPFDEAPELNNETYYGRSAWQVKSIEVY